MSGPSEEIELASDSPEALLALENVKAQGWAEAVVPSVPEVLGLEKKDPAKQAAAEKPAEDPAEAPAETAKETEDNE